MSFSLPLLKNIISLSFKKNKLNYWEAAVPAIPAFWALDKADIQNQTDLSTPSFLCTCHCTGSI